MAQVAMAVPDTVRQAEALVKFNAAQAGSFIVPEIAGYGEASYGHACPLPKNAFHSRARQSSFEERTDASLLGASDEARVLTVCCNFRATGACSENQQFHSTNARCTSGQVHSQNRRRAPEGRPKIAWKGSCTSFRVSVQPFGLLSYLVNFEASVCCQSATPVHRQLTFHLGRRH